MSNSDPRSAEPPETDPLDGVIGQVRAALKKGTVPASIYNDPEVHALELERIFARAWVFVGHESEIPAPGDYRLRYIGEDTFIFIRDEAGVVRVLYDACRHRGTQLCRAETGNASHFRCPYHGWTFQNDGRLVGIPVGNVAYSKLDKSDWGLIQANRVEVLHGLVFASLVDNGPSLADYLGDFKWYMDLHFGFGKQKVIGEPQRWVMDVNWKIPSENFAGDDYHTLVLHKSVFDLDIIQIPAAANMLGNHIQAGGPHAGHSMSFSVDPDPNGPGPYYWGLPEDVVAKLDLSALDEEQRDIARRARVSVGTIFPNLSWLMVPISPDPKNRPAVPIFTLRQWQPKGPGKMEIWNWMMTWEDAPEELQRASYQATMATFGSSGLFEQDDAEPWSSMTRISGSVFARKAEFNLNYQMGHDGIGDVKPVTDFPGPGTVWSNRYEEGVQRNLLYNWIGWMSQNGDPNTAPAMIENPVLDIGRELCARRGQRS